MPENALLHHAKPPSIRSLPLPSGPGRTLPGWRSCRPSRLLPLALLLAGLVPGMTMPPATASQTIRLSAPLRPAGKGPGANFPPPSVPEEGTAATSTNASLTPGPAMDEATSSLCRNATAQVERALRLPEGFLAAISRVETGRPGTNGTLAPWPWSINAGGTSHYYASRLEAITAVQALQQQGVQSIDVGCLQVNLLHHRGAFPSLEAAFDPYSNARYAGMFLQKMRDQAGSWPRAAAAYHSQTASMGSSYLQQVLQQWAIPLGNHIPHNLSPGLLPGAPYPGGAGKPAMPAPFARAGTQARTITTMNQPAGQARRATETGQAGLRLRDAGVASHHPASGGARHGASPPALPPASPTRHAPNIIPPTAFPPHAASIGQASQAAIRSLANAHGHIPFRPGLADAAQPVPSPFPAQGASARPSTYDHRQFRPFRGLFRPAMPPPPHQRMKSTQQGRGLATYRAMPVHDVSPMPHPSAY